MQRPMQFSSSAVDCLFHCSLMLERFTKPRPAIGNHLILVSRAVLDPRPQIQKGCHFSSPPEPVGSAAPKFASKINSLSFQEVAARGLALSCPAQGSPIPSFRQENHRHLRIHQDGEQQASMGELFSGSLYQCNTYKIQTSHQWPNVTF